MLRVKSFVIALLLLPSVYIAGQNARAHQKAAQQFIDNGYYEEAIEEFNRAIDLEPENGAVYESRALCLEKTGDWQKAAVDFEKAAVFNSNTATNFYAAANIYAANSESEKAFLVLNKALNSRPNYYEAYLLQCNLFLESRNYQGALQSAIHALDAKNTAFALYLKGLCEYNLNNLTDAEPDLEKAVIKDKLLLDAYLLLAKIQLQNGKTNNAIGNCNFVILNQRNSIEAYVLRSRAFDQLKEIDKAVDDLSRAISIDSLNASLYIERGDLYLKYAQFLNAINDYSIALSFDLINTHALNMRALAYEKMDEKPKAISDYSLLLSISDDLDENQKLALESKIFDLKRETKKPVISILEPLSKNQSDIIVTSDKTQIVLKGNVYDENTLKYLRVNNDTILFNNKEIGNRNFSVTIPTTDLEYVSLSAMDIYDNVSTASYGIERIETHAPTIQLLDPYIGDDGIIPINLDDNFLYIEGRIEDESQISSIKVDELNASYAPAEKNPRFTATIDITKKTRLKVTATDSYGNISTQEYLFQRDGKVLSDDSPMGKTWVILIENAEYKDFSNLNSPTKDILQLQQALSNYKINKVIVKKNLTKREMERFFSIDLRDLVRTNHVNSLLIWYAGHGLSMNETGFWIPSDATHNDEFGYYNINALKASLYSYSSLTHLLVVSDACSTGPGFNVAMRGPRDGISCAKTELSMKKSSQILTSTNEGYASDNSFFTRAFVNTLLNNENNCLSIDEIAGNIKTIMKSNTSQEPQFGKISGIEDLGGTFFFIMK